MTHDPMPPLPNQRRPHHSPQRMLPITPPSADAKIRTKVLRADADRRGKVRTEAEDRRRTVEVSPLAQVDLMYASNKWRF